MILTCLCTSQVQPMLWYLLIYTIDVHSTFNAYHVVSTQTIIIHVYTCSLTLEYHPPKLSIAKYKAHCKNRLYTYTYVKLDIFLVICEYIQYFIHVCNFTLLV